MILLIFKNVQFILINFSSIIQTCLKRFENTLLSVSRTNQNLNNVDKVSFAQENNATSRLVLSKLEPATSWFQVTGSPLPCNKMWKDAYFAETMCVFVLEFSSMKLQTE